MGEAVFLFFICVFVILICKGFFKTDPWKEKSAVIITCEGNLMRDELYLEMLIDKISNTTFDLS